MNRAVITGWIGCLLMLCTSAMAQVTPVVTSDKEKINIGEPLKLTFELKAVDRNATIQWKLPDSIPHFEYVSYDTSGHEKHEITITSFDSGVWLIDNIAVIIPSNLNDKPQLLKFPAKEISVEYDTTGSNLMHDIKPIVEVDALQKWIGYLVAAAALLSFIILVVLFKKWRKKKVIVKEQETAVPALEDFIKTVEQLKKQSWEQQADQKQHFSAYAQAVKDYFGRKMRLPFTKLTTDELMMELKLYLSNEQFIALSQHLRLSDAVKFAKFTAAEQDCLQALNETEQIILKTDKQLTKDV